MQNSHLVKFFVICIFFSFSCQNKKQSSQKQITSFSENSFVSNIEMAHNKKDFMQKKAVRFDIKFVFGERSSNIMVTMLTNSSKIRIDKEDSISIVYDGEKVFITPPDTTSEAYKRARFDIFTWSYFFAIPYKLNDSGTKWKILEEETLNNQTYSTAKLSFEKEIGDSPEDWYLLYADKETNRLEVMVYIVTYSKSYEEANKKPGAIRYEKYTSIENIPFATQWTFWNWNKEEGPNNQKGTAYISNIQFVDIDEGYFQTPSRYKIIKR